MENMFGVSKRQWKKWTPLGRAVFNDVYYAMSENQRIFLHPRADMDLREYWKTTAWNAAWAAAQAVKDNRVFRNEKEL